MPGRRRGSCPARACSDCLPTAPRPHRLQQTEKGSGTTRAIEVFLRGQRVAVHQRRYMGRKHGTNPEHMPSAHRRYAEWTPERFRRWAGKIGPNTEALISAVLASRPHPEQGFRTCLGILRSYRGLDPVRLEAVSARAVELGVLNCKGVACSARPQNQRSRRRARASRPAVRARQPARPRLLPLRGKSMLSHPTLDQLNTLGLYGLAKGFRELEHQARGARSRTRRMARLAARVRDDAARAEAV